VGTYRVPFFFLKGDFEVFLGKEGRGSTTLDDEMRFFFFPLPPS
jgi:hypothetical protein